MPTFTYTAMDAKGRRTSGSLNAATRNDVLERVSDLGLFPIDIEAGDAETTAGKRAFGLGARRVNAAAVESFTRELANLLEAGVSLSRSLRLLSREAASPAAARVWSRIHDDVAEGSGLGDSLARHPTVFPRVHVAMVRAGEAGGFLATVLNQIAEFQSRERDLLGRVKAAMVYPTVLAVLATGVLIFLLTYFIPKFQTIFTEMGAALPMLTRAVVGVSEAVRGYGLLILIALILLIVFARRAAASPAGRRRIEHVSLGMPGVGTITARFALVRFTRMLGTLVGAGVPLVASLRVAKEAIGIQTLADAVEKAIDDVRSGEPLARSLATCPRLFPPSVIEMAAVAEETGRLDTEFQRLAATYEQELDRRLRMLVALAEPAMLFVMAAVIGTIVVSMLLPLFQLQDLIQ